MKKVLITGATGFIGRHCIPLLLERGYEVHATSSKEPVNNSANIAWHQVDLLDLGRIPVLMAEVQPNYLLHFAWYTVPGQYLTSAENLRWVQSSIGLIQEFIRHGGKRAVIAGTCAEYDWRYGYCSETMTPLAPTTLYGICKHSLQRIVGALSKQTGLSAAWGQIFFLYGPYEHRERLVPSLVRALLRGEPAHCSHGNQIRDFLFVQDVSDAFVALLESDVSGPVNIASGIPVTLKDIIYKIAEKVDRRDLVQLEVLPAQENDPPVLFAGVSRLCNEVGWKARYDLDQGLDQTIKWWKKQFDPN